MRGLSQTWREPAWVINTGLVLAAMTSRQVWSPLC
jgi:hypothetical protein